MRFCVYTINHNRTFRVEARESLRQSVNMIADNMRREFIGGLHHRFVETIKGKDKLLLCRFGYDNFAAINILSKILGRRFA